MFSKIRNLRIAAKFNLVIIIAISLLLIGGVLESINSIKMTDRAEKMYKEQTTPLSIINKLSSLDHDINNLILEGLFAGGDYQETEEKIAIKEEEK